MAKKPFALPRRIFVTWNLFQAAVSIYLIVTTASFKRFFPANLCEVTRFRQLSKIWSKSFRLAN